METKLLRTPLYELYDQAGAKTVDFGGWELPVSFSGIKKSITPFETLLGFLMFPIWANCLWKGPMR